MISSNESKWKDAGARTGQPTPDNSEKNSRSARLRPKSNDTNCLVGDEIDRGHAIVLNDEEVPRGGEEHKTTIVIG